MADKDLVYFQQGIPAGQQMDRYSNNPGMLLSKNADIFSSSNSYKATAFSEPSAQANGVVDTDDKGRIILKSNGDIVDTANNNQVIVNCITNFDTEKLKVNYTTYARIVSDYTEAVFGTPKKLLVKYEGDNYKEIVVYSDRMKYVYSVTKFDGPAYTIATGSASGAVVDPDSYGGAVKITGVKTTTPIIRINTNATGFQQLRIPVLYSVQGGTTETVTINKAYNEVPCLYYEPTSDSMEIADYTWTDRTIASSEALTIDTYKYLTNYLVFNAGDHYCIELRFTITSSATINSSNPREGTIYVLPPRVASGQTYGEYYAYLPQDDNRIIKNIGEYYFIASKTFPSLYYFTSNWVLRENQYGYEANTTLYDFTQFMGWEIDPAMTPVDCVVFDEKVYLICNQDGNGYIFPCDLSGGKGTPYIAYGVEFKSAIVLNYLIYLVGDNRGISTLFVYSGTELVHIIEGNKKSEGLPDYVDNDEQYKFNGMMADWRGKIVLGTSDNRIFCYGQTYGGRGGSFIHSLADGQTLNSIRTIGKDLYIKYTEGGVVKTIKYQNDTAIKNYNTDFEIVYPVTIGSHLIEKEVYDLVCSYILPSSDCKLEFRLSVNHYYFWTFRIPSKPDLEIGKVLYLYSCVENYKYGLKLLEINGEWYTFKLEGDMPIQKYYLSARSKLYERPVIGQETPMYEYTEFNHFRKIGEITSEGYEEGYYRNENINTKLECPRTHSVQLMVKGTGTANYTPEVFSVNLVSNQRHRG